jgi:transcriptional regulator with XRE-family HTH domain
MVRALRQIRLGLGLRQEDVSRALGRYRGYISKVELAERKIDPIELLDLLDHYQVQISRFMRGR